MDLNKCNEDLEKLISLRLKLKGLEYNDPAYDDLEEDMADAEDDFNEEYGEYLEEILDNIHKELFPGIEVLLPTAYLANDYIADEENAGQYLVGLEDGVKVELHEDKFEDRFGRLVMLPNPLSYRMAFGNHVQIVWRATNPDHIIL